MEIKITTTHKITFAIEYFMANEGGMDHGQFGNDVETIEKAIVLLEAAKTKEPFNDWVITMDVNTTFGGAK